MPRDSQTTSLSESPRPDPNWQVTERPEHLMLITCTLWALQELTLNIIMVSITKGHNYSRAGSSSDDLTSWGVAGGLTPEAIGSGFKPLTCYSLGL